MLIGFPKKVYGNLVVLINYRGQHRIPYLPEEQLYAIRDARLRKIVKYAAETVPYYRDLFKKEKIDPGEIQSVKDLDNLPFIEKERIRKDPTQFLSTSRRGRESILFVTSGTTGTPIKVYHDVYSLLANFAFAEREREVVKRICGRSFGYRIVYINYLKCIPQIMTNFYRRWTFIPIRPKSILLNIQNPIEEIVQGINLFRPEVIMSYGSYLETFFRTLDSRSIPMHCPQVLVYGADSMTPEGRRFIEEKFGIAVQSSYQAIESFKIGFFCEERRGFHLHEDLCPMKLVNEKGDKVASGEKGEVVISNLVNHGTVLLNYRLGDVASMSNERCPCGRTLPLLSEFEGRVEDILFLPDGRFIHPRLVWEVMMQRDGVLKYQLIQHEPHRFELKLVTIDVETYQGILHGMINDLQDLLGKSAKIEPEYYEELRPPQGGKFKPVLSLCKPR